MGEIKKIEELDDWREDPNDPAPVNISIHNSPPPDQWKVALSVLVWLISVFMLFLRAWDSRPIPQKPEILTG
jgi:hypothetical protein